MGSRPASATSPTSLASEPASAAGTAAGKDVRSGNGAPASASASGSASAFDVVIVGGGINGAGIARDLAGRGCSVLLCEKDDLAAHTSSSSTKLIHGGLRYLEYYEFSLVRKALAEREVLLKSAPHIMWPLRFVMPHDPGMRPVWMIRAGLFLYDHLARREVLPGSRTVDLRRHPAGGPLKARFTKGFVYSDGWVDDARLVILNAVDAAEHGAEVVTGWRCVEARRAGAAWEARLVNASGGERSVTARALVNAAGPWASQFLGEHAGLAGAKALRLVKGSHIVVPRLFDHEHAYIFQNPDQRIIFAIPYERDFTLIGTTDVEHHGAIGEARIDAAETAYLCEQASRYFERPVAPVDVVWTYSGVRPLLDDESGDPSAVTRDYRLELDWPAADAVSAKLLRAAPLLTVWGGKITTFRKLAEEAAELLAGPLQIRAGAWTRDASLPGGDLRGWIGKAVRPDTDFAAFVAALERRHPELPPALAHRLARAYGSRIDQVLGSQGLGAEVAPGLFEAELAYLHAHEWARRADDVLWRRSKLGLHYTPAQRAAVAAWCKAHWPGADNADELQARVELAGARGGHAGSPWS
jgi:glycerol-3-phosphate dehydrogenase